MLGHFKQPIDDKSSTHGDNHDSNAYPETQHAVAIARAPPITDSSLPDISVTVANRS